MLLNKASFAATLNTGIDEEAGLPFWEVTDKGMSLKLVQRLPDQTRGFFMARGFSTEHAELIAQSCVFQTVFKNTSNLGTPSTLNYNLREWVVLYQDQQRGLKTREDWETEWKTRNITTSSQLAFNWALYPTIQTYRPGDYNWGMSLFNLKPGATFDLKIVWYQFDKMHEFVINDIQCAPDIHPEPNEAL